MMGSGALPPPYGDFDSKFNFINIRYDVTHAVASVFNVALLSEKQRLKTLFPNFPFRFSKLHGQGTVKVANLRTSDENIRYNIKQQD